MQVKLRVLVGKNKGKEIPVPVKRFLIGRADDCHMRPKSDAISRNHAAILINEDDDEVIIRDLNSRNGTLINGERISSDHVLASGDHLQLGKLEFEVVIKSRTPAPAAAPASDASDSGGSLDFDINEWLEEADAKETTQRKSDPDTRQFKLDETDRIALEQASQTVENADEESPEAASDDSAKAKFTKAEKKKPGKLPQSARPQAANSQDAAADMLKKFFNQR